jgi:dCTP deaminase
MNVMRTAKPSFNRRALATQAMHAAIAIRAKAKLDHHGPICIYGLCETLGVTVRFNDINMEGMYQRGTPPRIHLSARRPMARRTYNCAHELGHHVFGHGSSIDELREDAKDHPWEDPKEFLADTFAGFALMPIMGLRRAFAARGSTPETATAAQMFTIACDFGVGYPMTKAGAMFWSGETLTERLPPLIEPFAPDRVDCAAYTLAIGPEVYVSPNDQAADPTTVTVRQLGQGAAFTIPPGQFAFLLTEEVVSVPADALAFISIRAKTKFRGLVNVSGFHVDPGYRGQLTFAVFNAGPVPIHLKRGQPIFLIWFATLDRETSYKKDGLVHKGIDTELITAVAGELQSFAGLSKKVKDVDKALGDRIHAVEREQTYYRVIGAVALALVVALTVNWLKDVVSPRAPQPMHTMVEQQSSLPPDRPRTADLASPRSQSHDAL